MSVEIDRDGSETPSKTRRKKDAHQQQQLGKELSALPPARLQELGLPEKLQHAIEEYQRLPNSFGARRRQLQFIGKLMRDVDCEKIRISLEQLETTTGQTGGTRQLAESIAESVLTSGGDAIEEALVAHPQLQRQALRQFLLEYQRASDELRPGIATRLVRHLDNSLLSD